MYAVAAPCAAQPLPGRSGRGDKQMLSAVFTALGDDELAGFRMPGKGSSGDDLGWNAQFREERPDL